MEEHCEISNSQWMMVSREKGKYDFTRIDLWAESERFNPPTRLTSRRRKIDIAFPSREPRAERLVSSTKGRKVATRISAEISFFSSRAAIWRMMDVESVRLATR